MTVLLDTSFLFALTNRKDRNYTRVLNIAQTINETLVLPTVVGCQTRFAMSRLSST